MKPTLKNTLLLSFILSLASACASGTPGADTGASGSGTAIGDGDVGGGSTGSTGGGSTDVLPDPFAEAPDQTENLTNISAYLEDVLENGALDNACEVWQRDPDNRRKMLLCGKAMFFYEGFDGIGVPEVVFDFFPEKMPEIVGVAWSEYGLIPDPFSEKNRPLGFPKGADFGGQPTVTYGCASCHFGQMPDGRYAVGYPNLQYEYGTHALALFIPPQKANPMFSEDGYEPVALAKVRPLLDRLDGDMWMRTQLSTSMLPLFGSMDDAPQLNNEQQKQFASWPAGVLDAVMVPAPVDDGVHAPARILDLWEIPSAEEVQAFEMESPLLGWNGDAPDLHSFLKVFVKVSGGPVDQWPATRFDPLIAYLMSLKAPDNPGHVGGGYEAGREIFSSAGCIDCHDGPRGQSRVIYDYEDIGTDEAYKYFGDPELTGEPCCGLGDPELDAPMRHGLKAPRLTGLWAKEKLLHNGSVKGLEELLCVGGDRPAITAHGLTNIGHEFGCDDLTDQEKRQLIDFLMEL